MPRWFKSSWFLIIFFTISCFVYVSYMVSAIHDIGYKKGFVEGITIGTKTTINNFTEELEK